MKRFRGGLQRRPQRAGFGGAAVAGGGGFTGGTLSRKGFGYVQGPDATTAITLNYAVVSSGSAPTPGDLVCWIVYAKAVSDPIIVLTGSGWTQASDTHLDFYVSILAKVVVAADISSPATVTTAVANGASAAWVSFSRTGAVNGLSITGTDVVSSDVSAPTDITVNSSAVNNPDAVITMTWGMGDDDDLSLAWAGATPSINFQIQRHVGSGVELEFMIGLDVGGANIVVSKGDDGGNNATAAGYITVVL